MVAPVVKTRLAAIAAGLVFSCNALAAEVERPPSFDAGKIPGIRASGVNYSIINPVRSDGFLRIYSVRSPYGDFQVVSLPVFASTLPILLPVPPNSSAQRLFWESEGSS